MSKKEDKNNDENINVMNSPNLDTDMNNTNTEKQEAVMPNIDAQEKNDVMTVNKELTKEIEKFQKIIHDLEEKAKANFELAQRTQANARNQQMRVEKNAERSVTLATKNFVLELLPVIDALEQGIQAANKQEQIEQNINSITSMKNGMELVLKMFKNALTKQGVIIIGEINVKFDPAHHEAVSVNESNEVEADHIISVLQTGYILNGYVIRTAKVVIAK